MRLSSFTLPFCASAAVLTLISAAGAAVAQERAIENCSQMPNEELRIACLEEALMAAYRTGPAAEDQPDGAGPQLDTGAVQAAPSAQGKTPEDAENRSQGSLARSNPSPAPGSGPAADAVVREGNELGSEQVEARQRSREIDTSDGARLETGVSEIKTVPYRRLQITLDNGMIWRQISGDVQRLRVDEDDVSTVEVWETRLGGYKLKLNGPGRTIRVERIR